MRQELRSTGELNQPNKTGRAKLNTTHREQETVKIKEEFIKHDTKKDLTHTGNTVKYTTHMTRDDDTEEHNRHWNTETREDQRETGMKYNN